MGARRPRAAALARLYSPAKEMGSRANAFSWIDQNRRLSKDYEKLTATSEAFVYVAMSRLMVKRLARS